MKRRLITVALAVLLAAIGTIGILIYVNQADTRAVAGQKAVTVLVAAKPLPMGTSMGDAQRDGLLKSATLPAASVPSDAVASITPDLSALVTSASLPAGQLLLRPTLVTAAQTTGGLAIPAGMVAVSARLCEAEGVAGNVHPGAFIVVFNTVVVGQDPIAQAGCDGAHKQQAGSSASTRVVLAKVQVLSVGPSVGGIPGSTGDKADLAKPGTASQEGLLVTVALSQEDAARLILVTQTGMPYLALLGGS